MIDLSTARIVNAPDVHSWPATAAMTSVSFDGSVTRVDFTKKNGAGRWPDVIPAGWDGPLQYTIWLFLNINGQWVGSAFVQMWFGRDGSGSAADPDVPSRYDRNWYYAERWAPLFGHGQIQPGETIGIMVTSGNARDNVGPMSVQERSNVVTFAATDRGTFTFGGSSQPPDPQPPTPGPSLPYPGDQVWDAVGIVLESDYHQAGQNLNAQSGRWFGRVIWDATAGDGTRVLTLQESIQKHRGEWRSALGLPPV